MTTEIVLSACKDKHVVGEIKELIKDKNDIKLTVYVSQKVESINQNSSKNS